MIGPPIHGFVLMVNCNLWPNSAPLRVIRHYNLSDPEFDLSRSLKVKCHGVIGLIIYGFLLFVDSNIGNTEHRFSPIDILFGIPCKNDVYLHTVNYIILTGKMYIYKSKLD